MMDVPFVCSLCYSRDPLLLERGPVRHLHHGRWPARLHDVPSHQADRAGFPLSFSVLLCSRLSLTGLLLILPINAPLISNLFAFDSHLPNGNLISFLPGRGEGVQDPLRLALPSV